MKQYLLVEIDGGPKDVLAETLRFLKQWSVYTGGPGVVFSVGVEPLVGDFSKLMRDSISARKQTIDEILHADV